MLILIPSLGQARSCLSIQFDLNCHRQLHKSSTLLLERRLCRQLLLPNAARVMQFTTCCMLYAACGYLLFMPNDKSNVSRKSKFSQNIINLKALELAINARQGNEGGKEGVWG